MKPKLDLLLRRRVMAPGMLGLAGGLPAEAQFPRRELAASFVRVIADAAALQYGWPEGMPRLREQIALRLGQRGATASPDDVLITSGAQQAIAIAAQLACRPGDAVSVAPQTYPSALDLFRSRGLLPTSRDDARVAYAMPAVGNPDGRTAPETARQALLARPDRLVLEDDAYAELAFAGPPPPPLLARSPDRVLHIGTVSKIVCPGLRVGWLVVPRRFRLRARQLKQASDLQAGSLAQAVVSDFLAHDDLDQRLRRLRRHYRARADRLLDELARQASCWRFVRPAGGFSVWVETDAESSEEALLSAALDEGVSFDPGSSFRPDGAAMPLSFRLCYSTIRPERIGEAVRRLVKAWRRVCSGRRSARSRRAG